MRRQQLNPEESKWEATQNEEQESSLDSSSQEIEQRQESESETSRDSTITQSNNEELPENNPLPARRVERQNRLPYGAVYFRNEGNKRRNSPKLFIRKYINLKFNAQRLFQDEQANEIIAYSRRQIKDYLKQENGRLDYSRTVETLILNQYTCYAFYCCLLNIIATLEDSKARVKDADNKRIYQETAEDYVNYMIQHNIIPREYQ